MTLAAFGPTLGQARRGYEQFVMDGLDDGHRSEFYGTSGRDSRVLGDEEFVESIVALPRQRKKTEVTMKALLSAVCVVYDISLDEISSGRRLASEARSMSAWITSETTGCTIAQLAAATVRAPSSLSSAAKRIEARARQDSRVRDQKNKILLLIA
jgi:chromosomal replication initiation ATPase DnaA